VGAVLERLHVKPPGPLVLQPRRIDPERVSGVTLREFERSVKRDRAPQLRRVSPSKTLFICGMPRTGTALLGGLLDSTGLVGPPEEYFKLSREPAWADVDYPRFVAWTAANTAVNDVFGAKFVDDQLGRFLRRLRSSESTQDLSDRELLDRVFSDLRFVWLRREDAVAQAVSWYRAIETDAWWSDGRENVDVEVPSFDHVRIDELVRAVHEGNAYWERWFERNGFEPFCLTYEELDSDHVAWTRKVLDFLEVEIPASVRIHPQSVRQADAVNTDWCTRYRRLVEERAS
jgi:LPS sulfotransferase NodH